MEFGEHVLGHRWDWLESDPLAELGQLRTEVVAAGRELFDLSMINPDIPPPRVLVDRLMEASLKPDNHRYPVSRGIRKLRDAFAAKYRVRFSTILDPEREVCVCMGTKDALAAALRVALPPGSRVLLGKPAYPAYVSALRLAASEVSYFEMSNDEDRMVSEIETRIRSTEYRAVLLNFPNNPTGMMVTSRFFERLVAIAKERGVLLINDFVYGEMAHGKDQPPSLLSVKGAIDVAIEIYSLSKAYGIPGWRVGAALGNGKIIQCMSKLKAHLDYGIFLPAQIAAATVLQSKENLVSNCLDHYRVRAQLFLNAIRRSGWSATEVAAGICVWAKAPEHARLSGADLSRELLRRHAVLAMPGTLFGDEYKDWLRFAMVIPEGRIREVTERIDDLVPPCNLKLAAAAGMG